MLLSRALTWMHANKNNWFFEYVCIFSCGIFCLLRKGNVVVVLLRLLPPPICVVSLTLCASHFIPFACCFFFFRFIWHDFFFSHKCVCFFFFRFLTFVWVVDLFWTSSLYRQRYRLSCFSAFFLHSSIWNVSPENSGTASSDQTHSVNRYNI